MPGVSIRVKTMLVIGLTMLVVVAGVWGTSASVLGSHFREVDLGEARDAGQRSRAVLEFMFGHVRSQAADWSYWDDMYTYVAERSKEFEDANLNDEPFENLRISVRAILSAEGEEVWTDAWDVPAGQERPFPPSLAAVLRAPGGVLDQARQGREASGLINLPEGMLFVAGAPILTSEREGPPRGMFVWGRFLDDQLVARLQELAHVRVELTPLPLRDGTGIPIDGAIPVREVSDAEVGARASIAGVGGQPAAVMDVYVPRAAAAQGRLAVRHTAMVVVLAGCVWVLVNGVLLGPVVLTRLERLSRQLGEVLAGRREGVTLPGSDELSRAAGAINTTLAALSDARARSEDASAAKSRFVAHVSHEIRTPMTAIVGFAGMLDDPALTPQQRGEHVQVIQRNANHLLTIINDILDLSKIEAGRMVVESVPCSPASVLADVASLLRVRAATQGIEFDVCLGTPIPATIKADPTRLRQVLINLVGNAIKFTPAGRVRVEARYEPGSQLPLVIAVTDSGIGMSAEQLERLFAPFTQADASMSRRFGGTGLGLTISKQLVELLGGSLTACSAPGQGSTFVVRLHPGPDPGPMVDSIRVQPGPVPEEAPATLDSRILVSDDGPDNRMLVSAILRRAGASVTVVENGKEAVEAALRALAAGTPFDVILTDMEMPVMDGYAAARELRRHGYTLPIVALTAHVMKEDRERCLAAGCDEVADKPIDRQALLHTCARWTDRARRAAA
jgi:signal transduction histidine kinase